jgi:hypothetical protein
MRFVPALDAGSPARWCRRFGSPHYGRRAADNGLTPHTFFGNTAVQFNPARVCPNAGRTLPSFGGWQSLIAVSLFCNGEPPGEPMLAAARTEPRPGPLKSPPWRTRNGPG